MWDSATWQAFLNELLLFLPRLLTGLVVLVAFWIVGAGVDRLVRRLAAAHHLDPDPTYFLARAAKVGLLLIGLVTALGTVGLDVTALVTSLGLTGLAVGLAMKDIISNAVSGVLLLLYKPFRHGDRIAVAPHEGQVIEINLRYTVLKADDRKVYIPNATLFTNVVTVMKKDAPTAQEGGPGTGAPLL